MKLELQYEKQEDIPEGFGELFTEIEGKWDFTGVNGMKTEADVENVKNALGNETRRHKETKEKYKCWDGMVHEEVRADLDKIEEYKIKADEGGVDDEKVEKLVEVRVRTATTPLQRELDELKETSVGQAERITGYEGKERVDTIEKAVRKANSESKFGKVIDTAMEDTLMYARSVLEINDEGEVVTKDSADMVPGLKVDVWLQEMATKKPHWYPVSEGGNSEGSKNFKGMANNPWSKLHWNRTKQAAYVKEHGTEKGTQMSKLAGVTLQSVAPAQ